MSSPDSDEMSESTESTATEVMAEVVNVLYARGWRPRFHEMDDVRWDKFYADLTQTIELHFMDLN
jgi:hypothetical protein